jgi:sphinganine C4-monooxygenase
MVARVVYWYGVPALQFLFGILAVDTWEYFLHRAMHLNKWLYGKLVATSFEQSA